MTLSRSDFLKSIIGFFGFSRVTKALRKTVRVSVPEVQSYSANDWNVNLVIGSSTGVPKIEIYDDGAVIIHNWGASPVDGEKALRNQIEKNIRRGSVLRYSDSGLPQQF